MHTICHYLQNLKMRLLTVLKSYLINGIFTQNSNDKYFLFEQNILHNIALRMCSSFQNICKTWKAFVVHAGLVYGVLKFISMYY